MTPPLETRPGAFIVEVTLEFVTVVVVEVEEVVLADTDIADTAGATDVHGFPPGSAVTEVAVPELEIAVDEVIVIGVVWGLEVNRVMLLCRPPTDPVRLPPRKLTIMQYSIKPSIPIEYQR